MKQIKYITLIIFLFSQNLLAMEFSKKQINNINLCYTIANNFNVGKEISVLSVIETSGGVNTKNKIAHGILQVKASTARYIIKKRTGLTFSNNKLKEILTNNDYFNIIVGSWYLKYLIDKFKGDKHKAILAYNIGPSNVFKYGLSVDPNDYLKKYDKYEKEIEKIIKLK